MSFWCLQISQKSNEFCLRISALAFKKRVNQKKIRMLYTTNVTFWRIISKKHRADKEWPVHCTVRELNQILHGLPKEEVAQIKQKRRTLKVEKILKGSLDLNTSPSVKIQIICLR